MKKTGEQRGVDSGSAPLPLSFLSPFNFCVSLFLLTLGMVMVLKVTDALTFCAMEEGEEGEEGKRGERESEGRNGWARTAGGESEPPAPSFLSLPSPIPAAGPGTPSPGRPCRTSSP